MTEHYWQKYKQESMLDHWNSNELWKHVKQDLDTRYNKPKHHLQLYSMCRSDNPFIRQIKASPNITIDTVAELICRDKGCEMMYCQMMQKIQAQNRRSKIELNGCQNQYQMFNQCLVTEKNRILRKEEDLRARVLGIQGKIDLKPIYNPQPMIEDSI